MPEAELVQGRLDGFSTHPISRVRVTLRNGRRVDAILKRIAPSHGRDARREVLVYRHLLADSQHGAPELLGSVCRIDGSMLLLEDVGERRLERCDFPRWVEAFSWLGRFHAEWHGRKIELWDRPWLLHHDTRHHVALALAAARTVSERGTQRAATRLGTMLDRWFAVTLDALAAQPRTLLHGDLSGHNVMVQRGHITPIRPIDWEWAALGAVGWDLARLLAGWDDRAVVLRAAYLDSAGPAVAGDLDTAIAHGDVLRRLWYLRWWASWCDDPRHVDGLLDGMERTWQQVA
jgi:aminoglycoside/choline kinase family phosphotransferase